LTGIARWPAFVGSSVLVEMVLHTLAEVLLCATAETLGRLVVDLQEAGQFVEFVELGSGDIA
jgi:hypothetical protein